MFKTSLPAVPAIVFGLLLGCAPAWADGGGSSGGGSGGWGNSKLGKVDKVIKMGDYATAIEELTSLREQDPENPDVLNLLGYSYRQMGKFDEALSNYQAALKISPKHKGANEYLGELYLQTGQLAKAEERLAVLDKACFFGCKEYDDLKKAIQDYRAKNGAS